MFRIGLKETPTSLILDIDMELSFAFNFFSGGLADSDDVSNLAHYRAVFETRCVDYHHDEVKLIFIVTFTVHSSVDDLDGAEPFIFHALHGVGSINDYAIEVQIFGLCRVKSLVSHSLSKSAH